MRAFYVYVPLMAALLGAVFAPDPCHGEDYFDPPGKHFELKPEDMPKPNASRAVMNFVDRNAIPGMPKLYVPEGFKANLFAEGLKGSRNLKVAPNGDVFLAEEGAGQVSVLRDADGDGKAEFREMFVGGLQHPFGIEFAPGFVYIGTMGSVLRYSYGPGQTTAKGEPTTIVPELPSTGQNNHKTRNLLFSKDKSRLYISVGSANDVGEETPLRAAILTCAPDGSGLKAYATGLRNPVGLGLDPVTGALWTSVNERDQLGDDLVPDFITSVKEGGFYGFPYFYIGKNYDERMKGAGKERADQVIVPDVLVSAHSASLGMCFYDGKMFPAEYRGDIFAAFHGSVNRSMRTGYKVVRLRMKDGKPVGGYENFLTGFLTDPKAPAVDGRPVVPAVAADGALLVTDDHAKRIWRVSYGK